MRVLDDIGARIAALSAAAADAGGEAAGVTDELLALGEEILENWIAAQDRTPTDERREGFRLLALHRQGAKGDPSFNACRETCRELVYRVNLIRDDPESGDRAQQLRLARMVLLHLYLFVTGKLEQSGLGAFCCASRPLHDTRGQAGAGQTGTI